MVLWHFAVVQELNVSMVKSLKIPKSNGFVAGLPSKSDEQALVRSLE